MLRANKDYATVFLHSLSEILIYDQWLAGVENVSVNSRISERGGVNRNSPTLFTKIRIVNEIGLGIIDPNLCVSVIKDLADLVSHQIINGLHVQLGSQPFLHTVNDGKFGRPLFR